MGAGEETTHIFHIYRRDGSSIFLHPFRSNEQFGALLRGGRVVGRYGAEPEVDSINLLRDELHRRIESEVQAWVRDARFLPRFISAAATFLGTYLFMGFVFHGVVRAIETLTIAGGAAVAIYLALGRRFQNSEAAEKRRLQLRNGIDRIGFEPSAFVARVEGALAMRETLSSEDLRQTMTRSVGDIDIEGYEVEARQFLKYVGELFDSSEFRRAEKQMNRLVRTANRSETPVTAWKWTESRTLDRPLLSVYFQIKQKVARDAK